MQDVIWKYIGGLEGAFYVRSIWVFFPGGNVYLPYLRYSFAYVILGTLGYRGICNSFAASQIGDQ